MLSPGAFTCLQRYLEHFANLNTECSKKNVAHKFKLCSIRTKGSEEHGVSLRESV